MIRYARLKNDLTLFNKNVTPLQDEEFSITIPEDTIVKTEHWNNDYKLIVIEPYNSVCRKIDLEFLDD